MKGRGGFRAHFKDEGCLLVGTEEVKKGGESGSEMKEERKTRNGRRKCVCYKHTNRRNNMHMFFFFVWALGLARFVPDEKDTKKQKYLFKHADDPCVFLRSISNNTNTGTYPYFQVSLSFHLAQITMKPATIAIALTAIACVSAHGM
jgi:hypothetical protein